MKKFVFLLLLAASVVAVSAAEYSYVWSDEFPNYKSQIPSSDFTTADGLFRFTSDKAGGVSGPQFGEDSKAGLLLRLYAGNTLRIESLTTAKITAVTFVIGGNGQIYIFREGKIYTLFGSQLLQHPSNIMNIRDQILLSGL